MIKLPIEINVYHCPLDDIEDPDRDEKYSYHVLNICMNECEFFKKVDYENMVLYCRYEAESNDTM